MKNKVIRVTLGIVLTSATIAEVGIKDIALLRELAPTFTSHWFEELTEINMFNDRVEMLYAPVTIDKDRDTFNPASENNITAYGPYEEHTPTNESNLNN